MRREIPFTAEYQLPLPWVWAALRICFPSLHCTRMAGREKPSKYYLVQIIKIDITVLCCTGSLYPGMLRMLLHLCGLTKTCNPNLTMRTSNKFTLQVTTNSWPVFSKLSRSGQQRGSAAECSRSTCEALHSTPALHLQDNCQGMGNKESSGQNGTPL